jgi:hypothetical protein
MSRRMVSLMVAGLLMLPGLALAQDKGPAPDPNAGGGRRGFDPAQMRERMMNGIKEQLGTPDDEWKVLQPKIEKVMTAQRDTRGGGAFAGGGRRGGGGAAPAATDQPQSAVQKAAAALRAALENKDTPADTIKAKLTALREAREKAKADLAAAQKELKDVVTVRQEAVLVNMGMLE